MGTFTDGFCRPVDMGDEQDTIPRSHGIEWENRAFSGFQGRKDSETLELGDYPNGCKVLLDIIKRMDENYNYLAIQKLCAIKNKKLFLVSVKGRGSRFCMYKNGVHNSNRLYFSVDVKRARIEARSFDPECKREHTKVEFVLTKVEKFKAITQFGLGGISTMSAVAGEEAFPLVPVAPLVPPVQMSKKQKFEEKLRLYQASVSSIDTARL